MIDVVTYAVVVVAAGCALWAFALAVLNRVPREHMVIGAGIVEAAVLVAIIVSIVMLVGPGPDQSIETGTFIGYLIVTPLIVPVGLVWALAERSRWGTTVFGIAALVVPVMMLRLDQVWNGGIGG